MIREPLPICDSQIIGEMRTWLCLDCMLSFSMSIVEPPVACPRCLVPYDSHKNRLTIAEQGGKFIDGVWCLMEPLEEVFKKHNF